MISNDAFARSIERCFGAKGIPRNIAIALSGGVDSFCLTYLLTKYRQFYNPDLTITAITIDHQYREGSKKEAQKVGEIVQSWGVRHVVGTLEYDRPVHDINNFEEVARTKRYQKFQEICNRLQCNALFVGHNLNDQLETFLQRLQSNSSLFGLRGLHTRGLLPLAAKGPSKYVSPIFLYRPLLPFERSDIEGTCIQNKIKWFEDHSNKDIQLTKRNLLRHLINDVIPLKLLDDRSEEVMCVSKKELFDSYNQVVAVTDLYQKQVDLLRESLSCDHNIALNLQNGRISLKVPNNTFNQCDQVVFARFLYHLLSPISSVKHYHWSYAKLERKAIPRIFEFYRNGGNKHIKLTYLNVLFDITIDHENISFEFSRQPITRADMRDIVITKSISNDWSEWFLFDKRYWLRCRSKRDLSVKIVPYTQASHQSCVLSILNSPEESKEQTKSFLSVPLIEHDGTVLALPTYNIYRNNHIEIQWSLKEGF